MDAGSGASYDGAPSVSSPSGGDVGSEGSTREARTEVLTIQINGGRVIDPSQDLDRVTDVCLGRGRVLAIGEGYDEADIVIDARGMIVCPGLIDAHVHLLESGNEEDETIA